MGFCQTEVNHSVFIQGKIIIVVYIDNLLLIEKSINKINSIKCTFKREFKIIDLGPYQYYLDMGITQNCC